MFLPSIYICRVQKNLFDGVALAEYSNPANVYYDTIKTHLENA